MTNKNSKTRPGAPAIEMDIGALYNQHQGDVSALSKEAGIDRGTAYNHLKRNGFGTVRLALSSKAANGVCEDPQRAVKVLEKVFGK